MAKEVVVNLRIDTKDGEKSVGSLNNEFKTTLITMRDMEEAAAAITEALKDTRVGTEQYEQLSKELIKVNTELKNQELALEALDNEQVASEIKSVVGGLTDMAAGLTLVGASSKSMEAVVQTFAQVEGASKIVTGGMEAWLSTQKLLNNAIATGAASTNLLAASQKMAAIQAKAGAVAMRILNLVMNANPVFLIIAGITALIGVIAYFVTSTNEAAEANEKLNESMEAQNKLIEANKKARASLNVVTTTQNQNLIKQSEQTLAGLKLELANLEKKIKLNQKLTADEQSRLSKLPGLIASTTSQIKNLTLEGFSNSVKEARTQVVDNLSLMEDKFESVRLAINATAHEDGVDDIDYSKVTNQLETLSSKYQKLQSGLLDGSIATSDYRAQLNELVNSSGKLSQKMTLLNSKLGSAEQEEWAKAIENADGLTEGFNNLVSSASNWGDAMLKLSAEQGKDFFASYGDAQQAEADRLAKLEKDLEDRRKKFLENRKKQLDEILGILKREEDAQRETLRVKAELADDEIKLVELAYGDARQKIIDGAIAREEAKLQERFINGQLNEQQLKDALIQINENYENYLLDSEKVLLEEKKKASDEQIDIIKQRLADEAAITKEATDSINANRALAELQFAKQRELLFANQITDEDARAKAILDIKQKYLDLEIAAIQNSLKEEKDVRTAQYQSDISQKGLTDEQKKNIQAQYNSDIVMMEQNAQMQIDQLNIDSVAALELTLAQKVEKIGAWVNAIATLVNQTVQTLQMAFDMQAEAAEARRQDEYSAEQEALDGMLANREISQQQFDDKMALLEQKKNMQELAAKRKAFQQNKALAIVSAVMSTAQAVIAAFTAGASLGPAGIVMGPVMAGIAGALGAVQIGLIASQKFKAARGGVVPGTASKQDTVDAKLASGEMVINSESAMMFPQLLSSINQAGGGIALAPESTPQGNTGGSSSVYDSNQQQPMIKTYVLESDVTDRQKRIDRYERAAEF